MSRHNTLVTGTANSLVHRTGTTKLSANQESHTQQRIAARSAPQTRHNFLPGRRKIKTENLVHSHKHLTYTENSIHRISLHQQFLLFANFHGIPDTRRPILMRITIERKTARLNQSLSCLNTNGISEKLGKY